MVYASCCHCHGNEYYFDWCRTLSWSCLVCVKCGATFKITVDPKTKKFITVDQSIPCPNCKSFKYESEWDKNIQSYHDSCTICGYKETRKGA